MGGVRRKDDVGEDVEEVEGRRRTEVEAEFVGIEEDVIMIVAMVESGMPRVLYETFETYLEGDLEGRYAPEGRVNDLFFINRF